MWSDRCWWLPCSIGSCGQHRHWNQLLLGNKLPSITMYLMIWSCMLLYLGACPQGWISSFWLVEHINTLKYISVSRMQEIRGYAWCEGSTCNNKSRVTKENHIASILDRLEKASMTHRIRRMKDVKDMLQFDNLPSSKETSCLFIFYFLFYFTNGSHGWHSNLWIQVEFWRSQEGATA